MRVVFDTNVWIDWLYFNDIAVDPLKLLRKDKYLKILIDEQCLAELVIVLKYKHFYGSEANESHIIETVKSLCEYVDTPSLHKPSFWCKDPDDVKFLNLAGHYRADHLITKDFDLLKRKNRRALKGEKITFSIVTPANFRELADSGTSETIGQ
jgi:putative PIN family toxin of toxin-antitoxin system